jgi:hypothetical protein
VSHWSVLGQLNPAAGELTALYTVPAATEASVTSLVVCNAGGAATFRVSVAVNGAGDELKQYIYRDTPLGGNTTFVAELGLSLSAGDVVRVRPGSASLIFNLFGHEEAE